MLNAYACIRNTRTEMNTATVLAQNLKQFKKALRTTDLSYAILGKL